MNQQVSIFVDDLHMSAFSEVVAGCKKAGMKVEHVLPTSGVITGVIDSASESKLRSVSGVGGVEVSREIQLPPPSSPVQ